MFVIELQKCLLKGYGDIMSIKPRNFIYKVGDFTPWHFFPECLHSHCQPPTLPCLQEGRVLGMCGLKASPNRGG